ncbi:MAG TPA: transposase [Thermodesulfovibrionales bacterium]|nr:transposase [Thermodesulfovibrionales bacterium]
MSDARDKERARQRAAVVFAVRNGQITAEEGARRLGVSRKTYYEWESRALQAMTEAMEDRSPGRPTIPQDEEKQRLQEEVAELQEQLFVAQKTVEVRDMLHAYELHNATKRASAEKKRKRKKRR